MSGNTPHGKSLGLLRDDHMYVSATLRSLQDTNCATEIQLQIMEAIADREFEPQADDAFDENLSGEVL